MGDPLHHADSRSQRSDPNANWSAIREWRKETRTRLIKQRIGISALDHAAWSARISRSLAAALGPSGAKLIGFYWPFRGEYDPRDLMATLRDQGIRLALPVIVERDQPLIFREWHPGSLMTQGVWNVPMPESGGRYARPAGCAAGRLR